MHSNRVWIAPDGAIFITVPIAVPLGEPELQLMLHRGRWLMFWCGRRLRAGALPRV